MPCWLCILVLRGIWRKELWWDVNQKSIAMACPMNSSCCMSLFFRLLHSAQLSRAMLEGIEQWQHCTCFCATSGGKCCFSLFSHATAVEAEALPRSETLFSGPWPVRQPVTPEFCQCPTGPQQGSSSIVRGCQTVIDGPSYCNIFIQYASSIFKYLQVSNLSLHVTPESDPSSQVRHKEVALVPGIVKRLCFQQGLPAQLQCLRSCAHLSRHLRSCCLCFQGHGGLLRSSQ